MQISSCALRKCFRQLGWPLSRLPWGSIAGTIRPRLLPVLLAYCGSCWDGVAGQEAGQVGNAEKAGSALARQCARQGARVEKRWILGRGGGWQEVEVLLNNCCGENII